MSVPYLKKKEKKKPTLLYDFCTNQLINKPKLKGVCYNKMVNIIIWLRSHLPKQNTDVKEIVLMFIRK